MGSARLTASYFLLDMKHSVLGYVEYDGDETSSSRIYYCSLCGTGWAWKEVASERGVHEFTAQARLCRHCGDGHLLNDTDTPLISVLPVELLKREVLVWKEPTA